MKVAVLGAGVVGVASAYYLAQAGHHVIVIDRQPGPGLETSFANGGQISATHAVPWANPGAIGQALKWLGRADAPLLFRLRADPAQWAWALRFLRNCTSARTRTNVEKILRVALYSRAELQRLRQFTNIQYDQRSLGVLHVFRDSRDFDAAVQSSRMIAAFGCTQRILSAPECLQVEPALAGVAGDLVGGVHSPEDESGDAHLFTRALAALAKEVGTEFRYGVTIRSLRTEANRVAAIETADAPVVADAYLLALGSYSPLLLRPLGISLPVYPGKGYSVTLPVSDSGRAPKVSLIDDRFKLVYSRLGERLRIAGTAEFTGYDTSLDEVRCRAILDRALDLFPGVADPAAAEYWAGLRPSTPDGVPVLGRTRYDNLFLNTGHGTLGWTMACGSGRVIADLISEKTPEISLDGLGPERF